MDCRLNVTMFIKINLGLIIDDSHKSLIVLKSRYIFLKNCITYVFEQNYE